ncbi:OprO/OprP family phosphate-selective porin [Swaminathania salitolerans]|uniref:OprO/OprP family phosphate-selective porin n=1 Tax=Swaminathania salitolerans TaxID=182838 RepID=UPI0011BF2329|nr:porin [Swaminathania salitolerans]
MRLRCLTTLLLLCGACMPIQTFAAGKEDDIAALRREMHEMRAQMQGEIAALRQELARERASRKLAPGKLALGKGTKPGAARTPGQHEHRAETRIAKVQSIDAPSGPTGRRPPAVGHHPEAHGSLPDTGALDVIAPQPTHGPDRGNASHEEGRNGAIRLASARSEAAPGADPGADPGAASGPGGSSPARGGGAHDVRLDPPPDHGLNMSLADFRHATRTAETVSIGGIRIGFPRGRPTIASDDGLYAFSAGLVMHLDIGGFPSSGPSDGQTGRFPKLNENARRLRLPLTWRYGNLMASLTPEWGRTVDGTAGLYEANMVYAGVRNSQFVLGYYQPRVTMHDAESSNGFMFMERASVSEVVRLIAAGDTRMTFGGRSHGERWYLGAYLTGQTYGDRTNDPTVSDSQVGSVLRVTGRPIATKTTDLHIGVSSTMSFKRNQTARGRVLSLSDRPETRLTNERLISTGTITDVKNVWAIGPEIGLRYENALIQAEYYHIGVDRNASASRKGPAPDLGFQGYYVEGSYTLLGKPRRYSPKDGAFAAPAPNEEFDLWHNHWGALELVGRYSVMDFNSHLRGSLPASATGGVRGGVQTVWSGGLDWYPSRHYRIQLQYNHIEATRSETAGSVNTRGRRIDMIGSRFQAAF